ncbi:MAG: septum formation initiator family protein [Dehalococcoidia bacterium]
MRRDIAALEARRQRLDALRAYMESDEFVERAARQQGMVRPGDVPFIVSAPETGAPADLPPGSPWWERYFAPQRP